MAKVEVRFFSIKLLRTYLIMVYEVDDGSDHWILHVFWRKNSSPKIWSFWCFKREKKDVFLENPMELKPTQEKINSEAFLSPLISLFIMFQQNHIASLLESSNICNCKYGKFWVLQILLYCAGPRCQSYYLKNHYRLKL